MKGKKWVNNASVKNWSYEEGLPGLKDFHFEIDCTWEDPCPEVIPRSFVGVVTGELGFLERMDIGTRLVINGTDCTVTRFQSGIEKDGKIQTVFFADVMEAEK